MEGKILRYRVRVCVSSGSVVWQRTASLVDLFGKRRHISNSHYNQTADMLLLPAHLMLHLNEHPPTTIVWRTTCQILFFFFFFFDKLIILYLLIYAFNHGRVSMWVELLLSLSTSEERFSCSLSLFLWVDRPARGAGWKPTIDRDGGISKNFYTGDTIRNITRFGLIRFWFQFELWFLYVILFWFRFFYVNVMSYYIYSK